MSQTLDFQIQEHENEFKCINMQFFAKSQRDTVIAFPNGPFYSQGAGWYVMKLNAMWGRGCD